MPELDPAMAEILAMLQAEALPPYETMAAAEARAECERRNAGTRTRRPWPRSTT
jgi:hypothetical protein